MSARAAAMAQAWRQFDAGAPDAKARLAATLSRYPREVPADRGAVLLALVQDADINPESIAMAGWIHLWRDTALLAGAPPDIAARLEDDALALALLRETAVTHREAEAALPLRRTLGALLDGPIDADVLREARRRVLALPPAAIPQGRDFFTLSGVHDLLLHRHEDPFDVPRIRHAMQRLGLELIHFAIPDVEAAAQYRTEHPDDPLQRDFAGWAALERSRPTLYARMYEVWCRKAG